MQILPWGGTRRGHRLKVTPAQEIAARPAIIAERRHAGARGVDLLGGKVCC